MRLRILLTGARGQLGAALAGLLPAHGDVVAMDRSTLDLADADAIVRVMREVAPDLVVNAGAYTAVDLAERERDAAFAVNARAPGILAEEARRRGAVLIHYSTDYVFDGTGTRPYREDDPTAPLGVYGASKLAGEQAIQGSGARHLILRTAWVYAAHGKNFLLTMLRLAKERDELRVVADQVGTPTSAALIADTTAGLLSQPLRDSGLWHLTAHGQTSWHGFATAIMEEATARGLLDRAPRVVPIATAEYPTPARRPAYSCLDTTAIAADFGLPPPTWQIGLSSVLDSIGGPRTLGPA